MTFKSPAGGEPLDEDLKQAVRADLEYYWNFNRTRIALPRELKTSWHYPYNLTIEENMTPCTSSIVNQFCNKLSTLYFLPSRQIGKQCPYIIFGCLFKHWLQCYNNIPDADFQSFIANPVRITPDGLSSPRKILQYHQLACNWISEALDLVAQGKTVFPGYEVRPERRKALPLQRAIIMLIDELDEVTEEYEDGISLEEYSRNQNVLLLRTGDESRLSAPISFEELRPLPIPVGRDDITRDEIDAVRVCLADAVRFMTRLQAREDAAFPGTRKLDAVDLVVRMPIFEATAQAPYGYVMPRALTAEEWAERLLEQAEEVGVENNNRVVKESLDRVMAARKTGIFIDFEPLMLQSRWK